MSPENEGTFIDIDRRVLRERLKSIGAKLTKQETLMERTIFDVDEHSYIRVRDEGNMITLSYKRLDDLSISGMKEVCLMVHNYKEAVKFVKACGFKVKARQETKREEWEFSNVKICIDTWPWIPTFVEIEAPSARLVRRTAVKLGFNIEDMIFGAVDEVYKKYYDVTSHEINYCPEIRFTAVPAWLANKRRVNKAKTQA